MDFPPLTAGRLLRRYKRFLADIELPDEGGEVTVHCPNTGAMTGCQAFNAPVWLSHHDSPRRKLAWTWELISTETGLVCIHSVLANRVVEEGLRRGLFPTLFSQSEALQREALLCEGARADFFIPSAGGTYLEVKSATLHCGGGRGRFSRHRQSSCDQASHRIAVGDAAWTPRSADLLCPARRHYASVTPAADIDPTYSAQLRQALAEGLEVYTLFNDITTRGIYPRSVRKWEML